MNLLISIILEQFHKKIQFTLRKNSKRIIFSEVEVILHTLFRFLLFKEDHNRGGRSCVFSVRGAQYILDMAVNAKISEV